MVYKLYIFVVFFLILLTFWIALIVKHSHYLSCAASHLNELSGYYLHHFPYLEANICYDKTQESHGNISKTEHVTKSRRDISQF